MRRFLPLIVMCILCGILSGCGYTTRSTLRSDLKTIYIESFTNNIDFTSASGENIYLPLLEIKIREAIISRYQFDGNLKIAKEDEADLILTGTLNHYSRDSLRVDDNDDVEEYRVRITVSLELYDNTTQGISWIENSFSGEEEYFVSGTLAKPEDAAVDAAAEDLARRIVERTIESW